MNTETPLFNGLHVQFAALDARLTALRQNGMPEDMGQQLIGLEDEVNNLCAQLAEATPQQQHALSPTLERCIDHLNRIIFRMRS